MKTLKFRKKLSEIILNKEKYITWRLFDDKNISKGDIISLVVWETNEEFGCAEVINVKETKFKDLTEEDKKGHENFSSDEEMYKTYSRYYNQEVGPDTKLKVIKYKLLK